MSSGRYISTRGEAPELGFEDVVLTGLARDGGLYLPKTWPVLSGERIAAFAGRPFADVAVDVIEPFTGGAVSRAELSEIALNAYATFGHPATTPLVQLAPNQFVLELFHGPTLAFKDVAMQFLARLMDLILEKRRRRATIVCATSGDTGGAAVEAFRGSANVDIVVLFPKGRVSGVQRRMMTTATEANVHALSIDGTFDDCQALVKAMFNDLAFRDAVALSGVNSINWARVAPQITYYFAAAAALGAPHREISFVVPTGNFGDIFAGYAAKCMGLPVGRLTVASNDNDILPRTMATGTYEKRGVTATSSPSMDIEVSSNFERYLFEAAARDAGLIRTQMASLAQSGRFDVQGGAARLARDFTAASASEAEVASIIRQTLSETGYLIEPHTACALIASRKQPPSTVKPATPEVILATAHPAKFAEAMTGIIGNPAPLPARLAHLLTATERITDLENDLIAVQTYIRDTCHRHSGT